MPALANARHELFSVLVAKGTADSAECYRRSGFKPKTQRSAESAASALLRVIEVANRVAELKAMLVESAKVAISVTTVDVIGVLDAIARYELGDIFEWRWSGKGRNRRMILELKDLKKIPPRARMAIRSVTMTADGPKITLADRVPAARLIGQHLGMFKDEDAGSVTYIDKSQHVTYVDAPKAETVEQWQARVARQRGMKLVEASKP